MKLNLDQLKIMNQIIKEKIADKAELYEKTGDDEWILPDLQQLEAIQDQIERSLLEQ